MYLVHMLIVKHVVTLVNMHHRQYDVQPTATLFYKLTWFKCNQVNPFNVVPLV